MGFYSFTKGVVTIIFNIFYRIEINGVENIPKEGRLIICSNHISLRDPIILAIVVPRQLFFMAKKELFKNELLKLLFKNLGAFPVNRDKSDLTAIKNSIKVLNNNNVLGLFPEGTRVKEKKISNAMPGIAMISLKAKAPIVPIYINTNYNLFSKIKISIGQPIVFDDWNGKKKSGEEYKELSEKVMEKIYTLDSIDSNEK